MNKCQSVDLVITDMTMPGLTGDRLAARIFQKYPDLPVILCTGYSETMSRDKALSLGIREYMQKPLAMHELLRTVRRVLDQQKA